MLNPGQKHRSFIIRSRWLFPVTRRPLENAWLRVERGVVTGFGVWPPRTAKSIHVIDKGNAIIAPGFVNAHTHLEFSSCQKPFDTKGGLHEWIHEVVSWKRKQSRPSTAAHEKITAAIASGTHESAACGVVALGEIATSDIAYNEISGRLRLRIFHEVLGLDRSTIKSLPSRVVSSFRDSQKISRGGVAVGLSPHAPYSTQWHIGQAAVAAAQNNRATCQRSRSTTCVTPLAMHLAESRFEEEFLHNQTGPFRTLFNDLGIWPEHAPKLATTADWVSLLAKSGRGLIIHGTHLVDNQQAMARLKRHRHTLALVVCPRTTQALSGNLPPLTEFKKSGVRVCLGTDGRGSNPDLSIRAEAACLIDAGLVTPQEALLMITSNGAWALGFEHRTGSIATGRPADFVILKPSMPPKTSDRAAAAIFDATTEVVSTFRGGRPLAGNFA
ncbi:MAG: amidohydrolase family protein [Pirellulales bacterium]